MSSRQSGKFIVTESFSFLLIPRLQVLMYKMFHLKRTVTDEDEATGIYIVGAILVAK